MTEPPYRPSEAGRFAWHELGEADAAEVVVYDSHEALTHLIDGLALDVHQLLVAHPAGLSLHQLNRLMVGDDEPTSPQSLESAQATDTLPALEQLLGVMQAIGLVHRG